MTLADQEYLMCKYMA